MPTLKCKKHMSTNCRRGCVKPSKTAGRTVKESGYAWYAYYGEAATPVGGEYGGTGGGDCSWSSSDPSSYDSGSSSSYDSGSSSSSSDY